MDAASSPPESHSPAPQTCPTCGGPTDTLPFGPGLAFLVCLSVTKFTEGSGGRPTLGLLVGQDFYPPGEYEISYGVDAYDGGATIVCAIRRPAPPERITIYLLAPEGDELGGVG